ncbi:MAG: two-component system response regulator OmpR [Sedimenticola sp.]|mgnify:FL=1|nr:MAG: two-component system response regulator OmpR [Sedimenticola sp.]
MESNTRILVIDDDPSLRDLLSRYLQENNFGVETLEDGSGVEEKIDEGNIDLVILDIMLPGEDGLSIAKRIKTRSGTPIIMLSAKGEDIDRIIGLEVGADDYLPKPFNPRELLARIKAVLRRDGVAGNQSSTESTNEYRFGPFSINRDAKQVFKENDELSLTSGEYKLLELFINHPNRVMSRDFMMENLKGYSLSPYDRSIDVRINRLRQKIEENPNNPLYIKTMWGEGYIFTPEPSTKKS